MPVRRLLARPEPSPISGAAPTGLHPLGLDTERDGYLYVPASYAPERPIPLVVTLHGAGGEARRSIDHLIPIADAEGLILIAPQSDAQTWDMIVGGYGPDVAFIDLALNQVFAHYAVDPRRLVISGFSDGASYALSLGRMNGDLFRQIVAFSPGFAAPAETNGSPRIFISHGTQDRVLPIDRCSRRLVPILEDNGYDVSYHEFDGPHSVPPEIVAEAVRWMLADIPASAENASGK